MKKILIISAFPPNQKTAGQDYTRRMILDLLDKGHKVSIIYAEYLGHSVELPCEVTILKTYKPTLRNCLKKINYHPFFTKRFDKNILTKIQQESSNFDILYFDFSQMHIYSKYVDHPCKILMCHDVICQKYTRKGKWQLPFIKFTENAFLTTASKIITFSEKDSALIKKNYRLPSVSVNFYLKSNRFIYKQDKLEDYFCFYGAWNRPENFESLIWFVENVFPKLQKIQRFCIIGGNLSEENKQIISKYKNFSYLGFVDNPLIELSKARALIVPLKKGAGVKVKVIDALTTGCPVIGSDIAFEGIKDNKEYQLFYKCNSIDEYIDCIDNWIDFTVDKKQKAADEFFYRYNENHFSDLIED